jgi:hypothetical protein
MPALKNDKFREYTRYAGYCLNMGLDEGSGIALRPTRDGCRMAKTSGGGSTPS